MGPHPLRSVERKNCERAMINRFSSLTDKGMTQDFPTRLAAIQSLEAFKAVFRQPNEQPNTSPVLLGPYLALYDRLSDDDEEIRDMGATLISYILSDPYKALPKLSFAPLVASDRFSHWLALQYNQSPLFCISAVRRLTAASKEDHTSLPPGLLENIVLGPLAPVAELLARAREQDTTLFAEEKQNLFVNPVREVETWSRVLRQLNPSSLADKAEIASRLSYWTLHGIESLTDVAGEEMDGPLGWTSKAEVFTLGMRVLFAADVLVHWARNQVAGIVEREAVQDALRRFLDVGRQNAVHELWLEHAEMVMMGEEEDN